MIGVKTMNDCMDKRTAINLLDNLIGMVDDSQENDYDTALKMGIEALKACAQSEITEEDVQEWCYKRGLTVIDNALYLEIRNRRHDSCDACDGLEDGDTLYIYSEWDGGIEFDHIRDIHFCPKCGRWLPNFEICDKVRKE